MLRLGDLGTHEQLSVSRALRRGHNGRGGSRARFLLMSSLWIVCQSAAAGCGGKAEDGAGGSSSTLSAGGYVGTSMVSITGGAAIGATLAVTGGAPNTGGNVGAGTVSFVGGMPSTGGTVGVGGMWGCYPAVVNSALDAGPDCGNGILDSANNEGCDDGNLLNGDGCSANCQVEPSWVCPRACAACVSIVVCGDRKVEPGEVCDDGNTTSGDGCDSSCTTVEPGWGCPVPGTLCQSLADCGMACGDSGVCGATPDCLRGPYCGDGVLNGNEQCDFGSANSPPNNAVYGSCMTNCQMGPHCGDGIVQIPPEECDLGPENGRQDSMCTKVCKRYLYFP